MVRTYSIFNRGKCQPLFYIYTFAYIHPKHATPFPLLFGHRSAYHLTDNARKQN